MGRVFKSRRGHEFCKKEKRRLIKKTLVALLVFAVLASLAVNAISLKAPEFLRGAIEKALGKKVAIGEIRYHFPGAFEIAGLEVEESEPFAGEKSFGAGTIRLSPSLRSLWRKELVINRLEVDNADIAIRKFHGKLFHALSEAVKAGPAAARGENAAQSPAQAARLPLRIHEFKVTNSHFRFVDYDAPQDGGFVFALEPLEAGVKNIVLPASAGRTSYDVGARLLQGRDEKPADIRMAGWTEFSTMDTDASMRLTGLHLPYFQPYYAQVTRAVIAEGDLDSRATLRIDQKNLTANADFEIASLLFESYETGNQLFGLKAEELLSFLKDSAGRLKFQITVRWNIADKTVKAREVLRRSIERSLKNTVLGNIGNILENTLQKIGEGGVDKGKEGAEATLKKIKELFKY